jgi:hypothetical protein
VGNKAGEGYKVAPGQGCSVPVLPAMTIPKVCRACVISEKGPDFKVTLREDYRKLTSCWTHIKITDGLNALQPYRSTMKTNW